MVPRVAHFRRGDEFNSYVVEKILRSNPVELPLFNRHKMQELKDLDTDPPVLLLGFSAGAHLVMTAAGVLRAEGVDTPTGFRCAGSHLFPSDTWSDSCGLPEGRHHRRAGTDAHAVPRSLTLGIFVHLISLVQTRATFHAVHPVTLTLNAAKWYLEKAAHTSTWQTCERLPQGRGWRQRGVRNLRGRALPGCVVFRATGGSHTIQDYMWVMRNGMFTAGVDPHVLESVFLLFRR